mgnify:CR=1 FL=1
MVQDIEPNTAEHKLMQYSAMWNSTGEFIVEAGIEPVNVSKVTEKMNCLIFFPALCQPGYQLLCGKCRNRKDRMCYGHRLVGMDMKEVGLNTEKIQSTKGFSGMINGKRSYIVFKKVADNYIGVAVTRYLDREVVQKIGEVNGSCIR